MPIAKLALKLAPLKPTLALADPSQATLPYLYKLQNKNGKPKLNCLYVEQRPIQLTKAALPICCAVPATRNRGIIVVLGAPLRSRYCYCARSGISSALS